MSIFIVIRDVLIALALSWVGVCLEAQIETSQTPSSAANCAANAVDCATPQN